MKIRAQVSMVFHLDKCIGCHTCSIACKNIWTSRRGGAEYMWWNNVETKPGTGYPTLWEDQERYGGGWLRGQGRPRLRLQGRAAALANLFFNPRLPTMDDYYEPWTYRYQELFQAPQGSDQPVAAPVSQLTNRPIDIKAGPNWDDDLGGSSIYAANDPNFKGLTAEERGQAFALERMVMSYLPRICNHCLNPGCVAACPSGAIYKRGEDGIVLVSQEQCRAWRMCVSGCPYKKTYFNWQTGKAEKCILCYPRQETGQAPACFHSCVGRIRYLGVVLYDADRISAMANVPDQELVLGQRSLILDPFDRDIIKQAKADGIQEATIEAAQRSPVYWFVKVWKLALPLHPEFRTLPMLFYVPSLAPVMASVEGGLYDLKETLFGSTSSSRVSTRYLASLFTAGDEEEIVRVNRKLLAVRLYKRAATVGDLGPGEVQRVLDEARTTPEEVEAIYRLTSLPGFAERFVIPPFRREQAIKAVRDPQRHKEEAGFGFIHPPKRGW
jgi:nitrate reductase beta subunit